MPKREPIGASLRWNVFYRDGFCCRYCGAQAGQDGIELAVDHALSVAEGGDNRIDNLVTACRGCNGGKGARSLREVSAPAEVLERVRTQQANLAQLADAVRTVAATSVDVDQAIVDLKCAAYECKAVDFAKGEKACARKMLREFGPELLREWYESAHRADVREKDAIRYVCGCAKNRRNEAPTQAAMTPQDVIGIVLRIIDIKAAAWKSESASFTSDEMNVALNFLSETDLCEFTEYYLVSAGHFGMSQEQASKAMVSHWPPYMERAK